MSSELARYASHTLKAGSTSFAAAARLLDPATRQSASLLYAWCRHCDDLVDGQHLGHNARSEAAAAAARLDEIEKATRAALEGRPSPAPAYTALAAVAERHALPPSLPMAHLAGFRRDVEGRRYDTLEELMAYCWEVAGVVGIMMAHVMGVRDQDTLDRAADLGLAFQLTNIARDITEDAQVGRLYVPLIWVRAAGISPRPAALAHPANRQVVGGLAARLIAAAEPYYCSALVGIGRLPIRSAVGIGAARSIYRAIGYKVVRHQETGWHGRVSTSRPEKMLLAAAGARDALVARVRKQRPRDPALWRQEL